MKVGHFQCEVAAADLQKNLNTVLRGLVQAQAEKVEVLCLPESLLTGYFSDPDQAKENSLTIDGREIQLLLRETSQYESTFIVGFNELRDDKVFNSAAVARQGNLLGVYSKAFPCLEYFEPGRDFPVFQHGDLTFGVVICADGGYIDPARILTLKGAKAIFAPHYNFIAGEDLIDHTRTTRGDHIARSRENGIWFIRGNNYVVGNDAALGYAGVGQSESYILDPGGEIVCRAQRGVEGLICAQIDTEMSGQGKTRSEISARALGQMVLDLVAGEG